MATVTLPDRRDAGPAGEALLVVGMHRSGTSAVALELARQGWSLGASQIDSQPGVNRDGFGENRALVEFNERLLQHLGYQWYQLVQFPTEPFPEDFDAWIDAAVELLCGAFDGDRRILLKDPRLCLTLPLWRRALQRGGWRSRVVLQLRHPASVAESLLRRDSIPRAAGGLLWAHSMLAAERASRGMERAVVVYEQVLERGIDALRVFPDLSLEEAATAIDPALAHHRESGFETLGVAAGLCQDTYDTLLSLADEDSAAPVARDALDRLDPAAQRVLLDELLAALLDKAAQAVQVGEQHRLALATLAERDADIEQVRRYAADCEATIEEKDREVARVGKYAAECESVIEEKDREVVRVGEYAAECEAAVASKDGEIEEIRRYATQCETTVVAKDREIAEVSDYAAQCEARIAAQDEQLAVLNGEIASRDKVIAQRDAELASIRGQLLYRALRRLGLLREP